MITEMELAKGIEYFKFLDLTKALDNARRDHSVAVS